MSILIKRVTTVSGNNNKKLKRLTKRKEKDKAMNEKQRQKGKFGKRDKW